MNEIVNDLRVLRASLLDHEFEWDPSLDSEASRWDDVILNMSPTEGLHSLPNFSVVLSHIIRLRVVYRSASPASFQTSIFAPSISRDYHVEITKELARLKEGTAGDDEELPLFTLFTNLQAYLAFNPLPEASADPLPLSVVQSPSQSLPPLLLKQVLIWTHHLLATSKRKDIIQWSAELDIWSISKPGYPGVIFLEGESTSVDEIVSRLKALNWQALQLRFELEYSTVTTERSSFLQEAKLASVLRSPSDGINTNPRAIEVETMSELAQLMREAGLEDIFLTAMKIAK
ncbi:DUF1115-domain-containing protein [Meredithblackwellia eburnea MCA 4105]